MTLIKDIWCVGHLKGSGCKPVLNSLIYIMIHAIPYNVCIGVCVYVCMYVYICMYACMCMYVCMYVCVCMCMYVYACMYVCVCMYVCICMCISVYNVPLMGQFKVKASGIFTEINECDSDPCQNNGTCDEKVNGYECQCPLFIDGTNCEIGRIWMLWE